VDTAVTFSRRVLSLFPKFVKCPRFSPRLVSYHGKKLRLASPPHELFSVVTPLDVPGKIFREYGGRFKVVSRCKVSYENLPHFGWCFLRPKRPVTFGRGMQISCAWFFVLRCVLLIPNKIRNETVKCKYRNYVCYRTDPLETNNLCFKYFTQVCQIFSDDDTLVSID